MDGEIKSTLIFGFFFKSRHHRLQRFGAGGVGEALHHSQGDLAIGSCIAAATNGQRKNCGDAKAVMTVNFFSWKTFHSVKQLGAGAFAH